MKRKQFRKLNKELNSFIALLETLLELETIVDPYEVMELYYRTVATGKILFDKWGDMKECFDRPLEFSVPSGLSKELFVDKDGLQVISRDPRGLKNAARIEPSVILQLNIACEVWKHFREYWRKSTIAMKAFG